MPWGSNQLRRVEGQRDRARELTMALRSSRLSQWEQIRVVLTEEGLSPTSSACGDWFDDGPNGFLAVILSREGVALRCYLAPQPHERAEPMTFLVRERYALKNPDSRAPFGLALFAAAEILQSEGADVAPMAFLAELTDALDTHFWEAARAVGSLYGPLPHVARRLGFGPESAIATAADWKGLGARSHLLLLQANFMFLNLSIQWRGLHKLSRIDREEVPVSLAKGVFGPVVEAAWLVATSRFPPHQ
jgi:hypothetical protein